MLRTLLASLLMFMALVATVQAESDVAGRAEALKKQVIEVNRELSRLEAETLAPVDTQIVVFLAVDEGLSFSLDSVELTLNDTLATRYLYSDREREALSRGGVQRLYMGALPEGNHEVQAVFNGRVGEDRYFRKAESLRFSKQAGARYLELRVKRNPADPRQPKFAIQNKR